MTLFKLTPYLLAVGLMFGATTTSYAEPKPLTHKKELFGCYERINFSTELSKKMNEIGYPESAYEWFCFDKHGKFSSMGSTAHETQTSKGLTKILDSLPQVFKYDYVTKGVAKIEALSGEQTLYWQVTFLDKDITTPDGTFVPKNTLIMGLIHPETDKIVYWRYLKKLK